MKKTQLRNSKGQFAKKFKQSQYGFVNLSTYTSPEIKEVSGKDWIEYGSDNNYFQFLIDRYNGSPTNNAAINGISQAIYGKGLNATDANKKPNEYAQMISLFKKDVVRKLCYDLKLMGQCAVQIIYNKNRSKIVQLEHFPIETLRAEKANEDGEIPAYYYFKDWPNIKRSDNPLRIPAFGMSKENIEIYYIKPYKSGFYYYSPVDYQGGLQYCELEEEVSNYHLNNILNGLSPSMLISFNNGVPNQQERELIEQKIARKFSGSSNSGKFILAFNENKEQESTITPVQLSDAHNQYEFLSSESTKKIMVAHRIVSPMLLGIKDGAGLGNNAEEIKTASLLMDNTVIRPFQELLIDSFDRLLAYNDVALNLYFTTLQPLEFTEVDSSIQDKEDIEEETGVEMQKFTFKKIDGKEAYKTKEEAIAKAKEQDCEGYHEHEEDNVIYYMPCKSHEKASLSEEESNIIIGSLKDTGIKMSKEWVFVDEIDEESEYSNQDWAEYLIKEKKSTLSKIKKIIGLDKQFVPSKNDGSAYSDLDSKNGLYKIRYKYARGMFKKNDDGEYPKSRNFCQQMMSLSNAGVVWRIEDIDRASYPKGDTEKVNAEFRHESNIPYNIFELKGGVYCAHKWTRVLFRLDSNTEVSDNLGNYKKTKTIPKSYLRNPRGSKKAAIATGKQKGKGQWNPK